MTAVDVELAIEPTLAVAVPVRARPKGSLQPFIDARGKARVREDNDKTKPTMDALKDAFTAARLKHPRRREFPLDCPVEVTLAFFYVPPANAGPLDRPSTTRTPDIDKAERLVMDCLTQSGVLKDDARVVGVAKTAWYGPRDLIQVSVGPARGNDGVPLTAGWSASARRR